MNLAFTGAMRIVSTPSSRLVALATFDRDKLLTWLDGDEELLAEVIELFLADCPARIAALTAGVELRDAAQIRAAAHALRGAAANLTAAALCEAARELEDLGAEDRLDTAPAALGRLSLEAETVMDMLKRITRPEEPTCARS